MKRFDRPRDLGDRIARRRLELGQRADVSQELRMLSGSSARHPEELLRPRRSPLLTTLFVGFGLVLLVACVVGATTLVASGLWFQNQFSTPTTTVQNFYGALQSQNYSRAYSYTSKGYQQRVTSAAFTDQFTSLDQVGGVVDSYPIASDTVSGNRAVVVAHVTRRSNKTQAVTQTLTLVKEGDNWRVDAIASGDVAPVPTASS